MSVLTRATIVRKISEISPQVRKLGVARLRSFGSCARDEASPTSDVDLLVEFAPGQKSFGKLLDLTDLLESVLDGASMP